MASRDQLGAGPRGFHRGFRWEFARTAGAVALSSILGALFGALCGAALELGSMELQFAGIAGAVVGFATSPVLMLVTTSRDAGVGVLVVTLITGLAALVFGSLITQAEPGWATLATIAVYIASCVAWRLWSGSGAWIRSARLCRRCGYDLAGLRASECPECGESYAKPPLSQPVERATVDRRITRDPTAVSGLAHDETSS